MGKRLVYPCWRRSGNTARAIGVEEEQIVGVHDVQVALRGFNI